MDGGCGANFWIFHSNVRFLFSMTRKSKKLMRKHVSSVRGWKSLNLCFRAKKLKKVRYKMKRVKWVSLMFRILSYFVWFWLHYSRHGRTPLAKRCPENCGQRLWTDFWKPGQCFGPALRSIFEVESLSQSFWVWCKIRSNVKFVDRFSIDTNGILDAWKRGRL